MSEYEYAASRKRRFAPQVKGQYEGRWVARKVTGKYARIEFYKVGPQINDWQYRVYQDGNEEYSVLWGTSAVKLSLTSSDPNIRDKIRRSGLLIEECKECKTFPGFNAYEGRYYCDCRHHRIPCYKGRWYLCAGCQRRFKAFDPAYLCPECEAE